MTARVFLVDLHLIIQQFGFFFVFLFCHLLWISPKHSVWLSYKEQYDSGGLVSNIIYTYSVCTKKSLFRTEKNCFNILQILLPFVAHLNNFSCDIELIS